MIHKLHARPQTEKDGESTRKQRALYSHKARCLNQSERSLDCHFIIIVYTEPSLRFLDF